MVTVVTTTHNRPECFPLLERWMKAQTVQPSQWLVLNDSLPELQDQYVYTMGQHVVRRKPRGKLHSLCENWQAAFSLGRIRGDKVIVVEDDDYIGPEFLSVLSALLDASPLAGLSEDVYWHVADQSFRNCGNVSYASLACTGFRREVFLFFQEIVKMNDPFIDGLLWDRWQGDKALAPNKHNGRMLHVGIKGMYSQGTPGAGVSVQGHYSNSGSMDWNCNKLRDWIGQDAQVYADMAQKKREMQQASPPT